MSRLKFYADEVERHPWPHSVGVNNDRERVQRAFKTLARYFGFARGASLDWSGETISYAYPARWRVELAATCSWLIFAHEVAHLIEFKRHGESRHATRLAAIVDEVIAELERGGWIMASLDAQASAVVC